MKTPVIVMLGREPKNSVLYSIPPMLFVWRLEHLFIFFQYNDPAIGRHGDAINDTFQERLDYALNVFGIVQDAIQRQEFFGVRLRAPNLVI